MDFRGKLARRVRGKARREMDAENDGTFRERGIRRLADSGDT